MSDEPRDRGLHRHSNPPQGEEQVAVTGRPNDLGNRGEDEPALANSTLADRAKARKADAKKVDADDVEDKAISKPAAKTKAPAKKAAARG